MKSGHGERKSYIILSRGEGRAERTDSPEGAKGGAENSRAVEEETLGTERALVYIKEQHFKRRVGVRAQKVTGPPGLPRSASLQQLHSPGG